VAVRVRVVWFRPLPRSYSEPGCDAPNTSTCAREGSSAREASGDGYGFSDGEYLVGEDILPGKYHTDAGGTCYYTRLMNRSDDPSAIIKIRVPLKSSGRQVHQHRQDYCGPLDRPAAVVLEVACASALAM